MWCSINIYSDGILAVIYKVQEIVSRYIPAVNQHQGESQCVLNEAAPHYTLKWNENQVILGVTTDLCKQTVKRFTPTQVWFNEFSAYSYQ